MNRIVREPKPAAFSASTITCLISLIPDITAENSINVDCVCCAMIFASVVFPTPGGPQKTMEAASSRSICSLRGFPGPSRCCCPKNSSSVRGLIRSASGALRRIVSSTLRKSGANKLMQSLPLAARGSAVALHTSASSRQSPRSATRPHTEYAPAHPPTPAPQPTNQHLHCQPAARKEPANSPPSQASHPVTALQPRTACNQIPRETPSSQPAARAPQARETPSPPKREPPSDSSDSQYRT